jgi:hypothetical protein
MTYIPLDRQFIPWTEKDGHEINAQHFAARSWGTKSWDDVLASHRVVLLSEAGSGKSDELAEQARKLRAEGKRAFLFSVQSVARDGLPAVLGAADRAAFEAWKASTESAWLLIDSVDEAKLDGLRLETALRKIGDGIFGVEDRVHIVLSGRFTDWEFKGDLARFDAALAMPAPTVPEAPPLEHAELLAVLRNESLKEKTTGEREGTVVVLMGPLDRDRIRLFAQGQDVPDLDSFMESLDAQNLWDLARRPLDLIWLAEYWKENRCFGTLTQMLEASIAERLKETNTAYQRTDPVAPQRALEIVERIGAAFVFGRRDYLATPDPSVKGSASPNAFALEGVVPDLTPQHRQRLLLRPIFDPATFDRVRLHNDNEGKVRSYLAARWLKRRRASNGCSQRELFDLIFADTYGIRIVIPSAQQTAAWLSIWDEDVAREVVARDPYLLLSSGDPASLSLTTRRDALRGVAARMLDPDWQFRLFDRDSLRRLATPDIVPVIEELMASHGHNDDVKHLLLSMVELGSLHQCADLARAAAFDPKADSTTRVFGARAFLAFAAPANLAHFATYIKSEAATLPGTMLWESLDKLFPENLSSDDLIAIIDSVLVETRNESLGFSYYGPKLIQRVESSAGLDRLITWLLGKIGPVRKDYWQETDEEKAFRPALQEAALKLLRAADLNAALETAIDAALRIGSNRLYRNNENEPKELTAELHRSPERKRAAFWRAFERFEGNNRLHGQRISTVDHLDMLGWTPGISAIDLGWLLVDIKGQLTVDRRALAAHAVLDLWVRSDRDPSILVAIKEACADVDDLEKHIDAWENPSLPSAAEKAENSEYAKVRAKHETEQKKRDTSWIKFVNDIKAEPDVLRNLPKRLDHNVDSRLFYLWELLSSRSSHSSRYAIDDVSPVVPIVGQEVASALEEALIQFWRQREPILASEREPDKRNAIHKFDCMGIVGVTLEAKRDPKWVNVLTSDDATRAAKFATLELNGFPPWILGLCTRWPAETSAVLMREVTSQFEESNDVARGVVQDISNAPVEVAKTVAADMLIAIEKRSRMGPRVLSPALNVVVMGADEAIRARLAPLALDRFAAGDPADDATAIYLAAAFRVDPANAISATMTKLDGLSPEEQTQLVKAVLPLIFGGWAMRDDGPQTVLPVDVLERLVVIAFTTIKVEDDNIHPDGEAYSPDRRDDAERARSGAFNRLIDIPGRAAFAALGRLAQTPGFSVTPGRMREFMVRRAAADSEHAPWKAGEAAALEQDFDTAPQTPADLQRVAMRRLSDIDYDLHHADFAQGVTLRRLQNEREVQVWVANELRNRKGRAYTGEREPHVVEEKEPDIRLQATGSEASLPIEIKIAETWPLHELEKALKVQLGGRYLRAKDAKHGILLLVHKEPHTWEGPNDEKWKLSKVVEHLRAMAVETASRGEAEPQAMIAVIDVTDVAVPAARSKGKTGKPKSAAPCKGRKAHTRAPRKAAK